MVITQPKRSEIASPLLPPDPGQSPDFGGPFPDSFLPVMGFWRQQSSYTMGCHGSGLSHLHHGLYSEGASSVVIPIAPDCRPEPGSSPVVRGMFSCPATHPMAECRAGIAFQLGNHALALCASRHLMVARRGNPSRCRRSLTLVRSDMGDHVNHPAHLVPRYPCFALCRLGHECLSPIPSGHHSMGGGTN